MTIGAPDDRNGSGRRDLRLAELVALGLLVVEGLAILGYVVAGIANQAQFGGQNLSLVGAHAWGYTLSLASSWSAPWAVVVFLLGPLALAAWIGHRDGDELSEDRVRLVLRLEVVLAVLTILAGVLSIVGRVMQVSPSQEWSAFFASLGIGIGSVCLGILVLVAITRLAADMQVELVTRQEVSEPVGEGMDR